MTVLSDEDLEEISSMLASEGLDKKSELYKEKYKEAYQYIKDMRGFTYNTEEDMKDCAEGFLDDWFDEFDKVNPNSKSLPHVLSDLTGKNLKDIILNKDLMKEIYSHSMVMYDLGAIREKNLAVEHLNRYIRGGILKTKI